MTTQVVLTNLANQESAGALPVKTVSGVVDKGSDPIVVKPANRVFRWNLLFLAAIVVILTFPIWFSLIPVVNVYVLELIICILIFFQLVWLFATICAARTVYKLRKQVKRSKETNNNDVDVEAGKNASDDIDKVKHIVGICLYKEPLEVLFNTADSLAKQDKAVDKLTFVVGMEEGTPDRDQKKAAIMDKYEKVFHRVIVTIHPRGVIGEIPGKCSNFNYATREAMKILRSDLAYNFPYYDHIMTTADCDTVFSKDYTKLLENEYVKLSEEERHQTVWQSPLFYQMGLDKSPFFVRVTGLLRSFFMMGLLIPWNINTMSVFSLSLRLYENGDYTHPGYQMDDIIALIRWTLLTKKVCWIRLLNVATLSGPTSGATYFDELREWARQIRRWTIGAAEVFHYFVVKSDRIPTVAAVSWGLRFFVYYGILLCVAPLFSIIAPPMSLFLHQLFEKPDQEHFLSSDNFIWITMGLLGLQYFWFLMVFVLNAAAESTFPEGNAEKTNVVVQFFNWILTLPTILAYCMVELVSFIEVAFRGKDVCEHKASKKDNLRIKY
jgi:hypothetical protein